MLSAHTPFSNFILHYSTCHEVWAFSAFQRSLAPLWYLPHSSWLFLELFFWNTFLSHIAPFLQNSICPTEINLNCNWTHSSPFSSTSALSLVNFMQLHLLSKPTLCKFANAKRSILRVICKSFQLSRPLIICSSLLEIISDKILGAQHPSCNVSKSTKMYYDNHLYIHHHKYIFPADNFNNLL